VKNRINIFRYWWGGGGGGGGGGMHGTRGVYIYLVGYKKRYLVKIGFFFYGNDVLGGGFNKMILGGEVFINIK
jgi:hypothetical protein